MHICTLQIFKALQVNYKKMMVDVTRKTYYSLVAHQRIVGFSCYSYMKLQVCTVIYYRYDNFVKKIETNMDILLLLGKIYVQNPKVIGVKKNQKFLLMIGYHPYDLKLLPNKLGAHS